MSALPRPDLPPGPHRDLVVELHDLHHRAGWPSLRTLARQTGVSHTTVSKTFSTTAVPTWGTLELLVRALGDDPGRFHGLWLAAAEPTDDAVPAGPRIAGRSVEVAAARRHLERGTGLLMVTGIAGIGKTTMVAAACRTAGTFVATGQCLPLATEAPLLAISDALRSIHAHDQQWVEAALTTCPTYVAASLSRLLPELDADLPHGADDEWSGPRLFAAVGSMLAALNALHPLAVRVEDLHWADSTTQDLLEHIVARGSPVPLLGTWRLDAVEVTVARHHWWTRLRRLPGVRVLELGPLTRTETAQQLSLLTGATPDEDHLEAVHARAAGHPLFTEQLAGQPAGDRTLPSLLADLLDQRLDGLAGPAWSVLRTLGVADRGMAEALLQTSTGLSDQEMTHALHELADRLMLSLSEVVELRHPLLAEAVRRRLTAGETAHEHRQIAATLARSVDANPAEVATHWRGAHDAEEERAWRVRAARDARGRSAWHLEAEHWQRAVDLWPGTGVLSAPSLVESHVALIDALARASETVRAATAARRALAVVDPSAAGESAARERADLLSVAGRTVGQVFSPDEGLALLQQARAIYEVSGPDRHLAFCLAGEADLLRGLGRMDDAATAVQWMNSIMRDRADDESPAPLFAADQAWHQAVAGEVDHALATLASLSAGEASEGDPHRRVRLSLVRTDVLLMAGRRSDEIDTSSASGIAEMREWDISTHNAGLLVSAVSNARLREGDVTGAMEAIAPLIALGDRPDLWMVHSAHGQAVLRRGELSRAADLFEHAASVPRLNYRRNGELVAAAADCDLWSGRPQTAYDRLQPLLEAAAGVSGSPLVGGAFVMAARAAADLGDVPVRLVEGLRTSCVADPLVRRTLPADSVAWQRSWFAELARLGGTATVEDWVRTSTEWDRLARPHEAAYCRWRAAQVALEEGRGTVAARLLRRAAKDARDHDPLSRAIAGTQGRR